MLKIKIAWVRGDRSGCRIYARKICLLLCSVCASSNRYSHKSPIPSIKSSRERQYLREYSIPFPMDFFKSLSLSLKTSSPQQPPLDTTNRPLKKNKVFRIPARAMDGRFPALRSSAATGPKRPTTLESHANGHVERSHSAKTKEAQRPPLSAHNGFRRSYASALVQSARLEQSEEEHTDDDKSSSNGTGKKSSFQFANFLDIFRREKRSSSSAASGDRSSDGRSRTTSQESYTHVERHALVNYGLVSSPLTPSTSHPLSSMARTDVFILDAYDSHLLNYDKPER